MTKALKLKVAKFLGLVLTLKEVTGVTVWRPSAAHSKED